VALYIALGVVDFVLMRRFAAPRAEAGRDEPAEPVLGY
jgi:hypothetical protein